MKAVNVRGLNIGQGLVKIVVPIVGKSDQEIRMKAREIAQMEIHMVEWRADFYDHIFDRDRVLDILSELRDILDNLPILFTFRSKKEGGDKEISYESYIALNKYVANSGYVDLIDVEITLGDNLVREKIDNIHHEEVLVVGSNHDFEKTPSKEDIISRLIFMQDMGADILKIAVMPHSSQDVLTLLEATNEMNTKHADRPIVTMSMGPLGVISRVSGHLFGSSMTFGALGQISAPGQLPVDALSEVLDILNKSM